MYIVITSSPNGDGLTAACGKAAVEGIEKAGGEAKLIDLFAANIEPCRICANGWGICREQHKCGIADGLGDIQNQIASCDGIFLITPVYWGQPSEKMKYFCDRLRRCEAMGGESSRLNGKNVNIVAAAGGSGNGTVTCLSELEAWCRHVRAIPGERIGITRFNREPMLEVIKDAAFRMVK